MLKGSSLGPQLFCDPRQVAADPPSGVLVLLLGLWLLGNDGKMNTYMVLVLSAASLEWILSQGWKRP